MISFFLHSVSANLMIAKKRGNARKTPEIVRFRGFEAMISFLASLYDVIEQFRCRAKKLLFLVIQGLSGLFVVFQDTFSQESDF